MRTMPSVMCKLKGAVTEKKPKQALAVVANEARGIVGAPSAGALPRGRQQVKDLRQYTHKTDRDTDPLYTVMLMCKESEQGRNGDTFVQMVNAAPYSRLCTRPPNSPCLWSICKIDLLLEQKREIEHAVASAGEYRVASQYADLAVGPQKWFKMTEQQRLQRIQKFMKASVQEMTGMCTTMPKSHVLLHVSKTSMLLATSKLIVSL